MTKRILPPLKVQPIHETPEYRNLLRHLMSEHIDDDKDVEDFETMLREGEYGHSDELGGIDPGKSLMDFHSMDHKLDGRSSTTFLDHTHADE